MKVVIFAGGRGTRLEEETKGLIPKPLVAVGDRPMLAHIVAVYAAQGFREFVVAAGYRQESLQEWALSFEGQPYYAGEKVTVVDTGEDTMTGGRLLRLAELLDEPFMLTYGDGLADINLLALLDFHHRMVDRLGTAVTLTAVHPPARWGAMVIKDNSLVEIFSEKSQSLQGWINGGFYVVQPEVLRIIPGDASAWELDVLPSLAAQNRLAAFLHTGWWQAMDHPREKALLEELWQTGKAPWTRLQAKRAS
jgi:glucose-1-phosphate cytidylyltransferase